MLVSYQKQYDSGGIIIFFFFFENLKEIMIKRSTNHQSKAIIIITIEIEIEGTKKKKSIQTFL